MSRYQKNENGWQKTESSEALLPEPKKPEAAAPYPAMPVAGQLETTTPALDAPVEPPLMPPTQEQAADPPAALPEEEEPPVTLTPQALADEEPVPEQNEPEAAAPDPAMLLTEEQAAKRSAQLERLAALPAHLRLGVTLPGMRELLSQLPSDAVEQVNAKIPLDEETGKPKYPENTTENGYVNRFHITLEAKEGKEGQPGDGLAVCERLQKRGSPHVGEATVFVSWFFDTPIDTLLDALANFLKQKGLREEDTFFWVCDYVTRQTDVKTDLALLGDCVSAVGHTVLLMEPLAADGAVLMEPAPLKRAYCIKEVYYTQKSGAQFDVVMSFAQQVAFEVALVDDFDPIQASLSKVDVRTAKCCNPEDTKAILDELEQGVGFVACNTLVLGLLREALVAQARAVLARLPVAERGTSVLLTCLGRLLKDTGQLKEARPLYEEVLQARREALGDRHLETLISISNMGALLQAMGKLEEARPLLEEALQGSRETLGDRHPSTLGSIGNMGQLLQEMGKSEEARPLFEEDLQASKETLGDRHPDTLHSISYMADLLRATGSLAEAVFMLGNTEAVAREVLGNDHRTALKITAIAARLQHAQPGGAAAGKELLAATVARMAEVLGENHQQARKYREVLMEME